MAENQNIRLGLLLKEYREYLRRWNAMNENAQLSRGIIGDEESDLPRPLTLDDTALNCRDAFGSMNKEELLGGMQDCAEQILKFGHLVVRSPAEIVTLAAIHNGLGEDVGIQGGFKVKSHVYIDLDDQEARMDLAIYCKLAGLPLDPTLNARCSQVEPDDPYPRSILDEDNLPYNVRRARIKYNLPGGVRGVFKPPIVFTPTRWVPNDKGGGSFVKGAPRTADGGTFVSEDETDAAVYGE